jgi:MFS family permease
MPGIKIDKGLVSLEELENMEKTTVGGSTEGSRSGGFAVPWIDEMLPGERRALRACWAGWALDGMDTQMYSFVVPTLIATWGITRSQAGAIGTTMLMTSAIGGWVAGYLSDRIGRVKTLQLTILWFAVFSLLSGIVENYSQLLAVRGMMGFGFGGEYAAGAVLLSESVRQSVRGRALGVNATGSAVGWGIAAVLFTAVFSLASPAYAWRIIFLIGALPALLVIYVRRHVEEPEVYRHAIAEEPNAGHGPFEIFKPALIRRTMTCALLSTGGQGAYFAITSWLPTFLAHERGLNVAGTGTYMLVTVLGAFFGYLSAAYLSDRTGRGGAIAIFGVCSIVVCLFYAVAPASNVAFLLAGFPLGFFSVGGLGVFPTLFAEMFPTYCRGLSLGFVHNFGRATGALLPLLVGVLSEHIGLGLAFGASAAAGFALMVICALCLPRKPTTELASQ